MSNPPATKRKGFFTITMPIDQKLVDGQELISPTHSFDGLNWRVRVKLYGAYRGFAAYLQCEGDGSIELWRTDANIETIMNKEPLRDKVSHTFTSWKQENFDIFDECCIRPPITEMSFIIETENRSFARRPNIDHKSAITDVILVMKGQKIPVNMQILSAYSSYFDKLFNGNFKESKQEEIELKDDDPEVFHELLKMMYGVSTEPTSVENATRYLIMADKFDVQIVKNRLENFLFSTNLSIHRKIMIAEEYNLEILKSEILPVYKWKECLLELSKSEEFVDFSDSVKIILFGYACDLLSSYRCASSKIEGRPAMKHKDSFTITMPIDINLEGRHELISPVHTIDGLNWYVRVIIAMHRLSIRNTTKDSYELRTSLFCEGGGLWRAEADMKLIFSNDTRALSKKSSHHSFASWKQDNHRPLIIIPSRPTNCKFEIKTESDSFVRRPLLNPESAINDVILVLEGQKFPANKQVLSAQSTYFNGLFFGNFKESNQEEIEIKDTSPEDFHEILKMINGISIKPKTVENATRYLMLADMFDLQIVKERMENSLLSTNLISIHRKLLIAEDHNLEILKHEVLLLYKKRDNLLALRSSEEFVDFPESVKNLIFGNICDLLERTN